MVGNDDVKVWSCELDGGAPYGSLRPCHYLVTPLTFIPREREREKELGSPKTTAQVKLSGVNSAIITWKCQPAIKYNSSSGRKQISFDHVIITLSCRTIRRDQIFTFSVWGKAIRDTLHLTRMHTCHFALVINCPYNRNLISGFENGTKSVMTCQLCLNHWLTPHASGSRRHLLKSN